VAPPVFKTGLAANIVAGGFDSLPPPPFPGTPQTQRSPDANLICQYAEARRLNQSWGFSFRPSASVESGAA